MQPAIAAGNPSPPQTPTRRIALLEARLRTPGMAQTPSPASPAPPTPPTPPTPPPAPALQDDDSVRSFSSDLSARTPPPIPPSNPRRKYAPPPMPRRQNRKRKRPPSTVKSTRLDEFFKPSPARPMRLFHSPGGKNDNADSREGVCVQADAYSQLRAMVDRLKEQNNQLKNDCAEVDALATENEDLRALVEFELQPLRKVEEEMGKALTAEKDKGQKLMDALREHARKLAMMEREEKRRKVAEQCERLGKAVLTRSRTSLAESWVDGVEWNAVMKNLQRVRLQKENVEKRRKEFVKKRGPKKKQDEDDDMPPPPSPLRRDPGVPYEETPDYAMEQEDVCKIQVQLLKKEENTLLEKQQELICERELLVRELRRQNDERLSVFSTFPVMNERYQLLNLLGRGGFSEVYKALDLKNGENVACKIHQLASNWSEEKKRSFIRHAMREYEIHKSLKHPRVVQLVDIFEIDENTFCTVLEYCDGCDLDSYLRANKTLPEKEARCIIAQVFSGLLYLAEQKRRIIHYDLKPGNILLQNGEVSITDFGLSKIMSESESTADGMELTSQGAGTMWYLPPECFEVAGKARISIKVDVWSAGVILFQMLYGRKPFGHGQSQEKVFREKTVAHQELEFPVKPAVSDVAKDFMRKCLTRKAATRPDVRQALLHPFLRKR